MEDQKKISEVFKCRKCNNDTIEEVIPNVTLRSEVIAIYDCGDIEYGDQSNQDGDGPWYQCAKCGKVIASDLEELKERLSHTERG